MCYETKGLEMQRCGHGMCKECTKEWYKMKSTCPCCRAEVKTRKKGMKGFLEVLAKGRREGMTYEEMRNSDNPLLSAFGRAHM